MSYEKQNGVPTRQPAPRISTQSPKVFDRGSARANVTSSPATNKLRPGKEKGQYEGVNAGKGSEEKVVTPVKTLLSSNITPRSSARKARAETASPIRVDTSNDAILSRPASFHEDAEVRNGDSRATSGLGLRISTSRRRSRANSITSDGLSSSVSAKTDPLKRNGPAARLSSPENTPKFFRADDVRPVLSSQPLPECVQPDKEIFSDGRIASPNSSATPHEQRSKFFYANGLNESRNLPSQATNGSSPNRPQLQTIYSSNIATTPPRPSSPLKEEIRPRKSSVGQPSPRRHTRLVSNGGSEIRSPEAVSVGTTDLSRRSSLNSPRISQNGPHTRSPSVPINGANLSRRSSLTFSHEEPTDRVQSPSISGTFYPLPHSVNPPSINHELPNGQPPSQPQSPIRKKASGSSKLEEMNNLAANARRERKVLDLEISNSSLLAINRTLEREMRKQSAELRRFRRLSRSGRISMAPSSRSASGKMSVLSEMDNTLNSDDLTSSEDEDPLDDLPSNVSSTSSSSRPYSPTLKAARTRFQDPERLELDLAVHRALLLDSQKLNTSIRRCLAQSESLISSGKQALEYQTHPLEKENLGARVLTPDEVDGDLFTQGQALLSPSLGSVGVNPWERSLKSDGDDEGDLVLEMPDLSESVPPMAARTPSADIVDFPQFNKDVTDQSGTESLSSADLSTQSRGGFSNIDDRGTSEIASIDGLDDESTLESEADLEYGSRLKAESDNGRSSSSGAVDRISRAPSPEKGKSGNLQIGQPGYRGSMQGLSHYLPAFSIFGASQQA